MRIILNPAEKYALNLCQNRADLPEDFVLETPCSGGLVDNLDIKRRLVKTRFSSIKFRAAEAHREEE